MAGPKSIRSLERGLFVLGASQVANHVATRHPSPDQDPKPSLLRILHTLEQAGSSLAG